MASVLAEYNGFNVMLASLSSISNVFASRHLVYVLLKLFSFAVKIRSNRVALASSEYDTLNVFLRLLQLVVYMPESASLLSSSLTRASSNEACATRNELVEKVLLVVQPILQETQNTKVAVGQTIKISGIDSTQLEHILGCMNIYHIQQNPLLLHNLMTIVPYLSFGENSATKMKLIVDLFKPFIDFEKYNDDKTSNGGAAIRTELFVDCFTALFDNIPSSDDGDKLNEYLADQKSWKEFLSRPAVPYVLKLMRALCKNHEETQLAMSESCIPVLHRGKSCQ